MSEDMDHAEKRVSTTAGFLNSVNSPTFPIINLKFIPAAESDKVVEVRIPAAICDLIKTTQQTDEFPLVLPAAGSIALWSFDITIATKILASLGIMSDKVTWISNSQKAIMNIVDNTKIESQRSNDKALGITKEILGYLGLLEATKANSVLFFAVTDLIQRRQMDPDTIIYKIALGIYHSYRLTGKPFFPEVDDEAGMYLKFIQVGLEKKFEEFNSMAELPLEGRSKTLKITVCLLIAAYTYYLAVSQR